MSTTVKTELVNNWCNYVYIMCKMYKNSLKLMIYRPETDARSRRYDICCNISVVFRVVNIAVLQYLLQYFFGIVIRLQYF